jgi:hypothetical protein
MSEDLCRKSGCLKAPCCLNARIPMAREEYIEFGRRILHVQTVTCKQLDDIEDNVRGGVTTISDYGDERVFVANTDNGAVEVFFIGQCPNYSSGCLIQMNGGRKPRECTDSPRNESYCRVSRMITPIS